MNTGLTVDYPDVSAVGDSAILVQFGDGSDARHNTAALAFAAEFRRLELPQVIDCAPAIRSVLIRYDPALSTFDDMNAAIKQQLGSTDWTRASLPEGRRLWYLPICYDPVESVDLADTAELMKLDIDALVESHCETRQRLYTIGFAPGHIYSGLLPAAWDFPRLDYIKPSVPAGAVCVAIRQTVIFASSMPTGWRMIGRTPLLNFDAGRDPACLLQAGDEIQFTPITPVQFTAQRALAEQGRFQPDAEILP